MRIKLLISIEATFNYLLIKFNNIKNVISLINVFNENFRFDLLRQKIKISNNISSKALANNHDWCMMSEIKFIFNKKNKNNYDSNII
jgi:hypothetical protein